MSSEISKAERDAINAAIEAGKVQRIPQGENTFVYPVWDAERRYLVVPDGSVTWKRQTKNAHRTRQANHFQPDPAVTARRSRVAEMMAGGARAFEIAALLNVPATTIWSDQKIIRKQAREANA